MKESTAGSSASGIGFVGALTLLFIALKLIGIIDWSWWWVLSPIWIGAIVAMTALAGFIAFCTWLEGRK